MFSTCLGCGQQVNQRKQVRRKCVINRSWTQIPAPTAAAKVPTYSTVGEATKDAIVKSDVSLLTTKGPKSIW
jgi:hypothetical protein